jgi:hypothetical protein
LYELPKKQTQKKETFQVHVDQDHSSATQSTVVKDPELKTFPSCHPNKSMTAMVFADMKLNTIKFDTFTAVSLLVFFLLLV